MSRFIHLHTHSHYSFLQALPKAEDLVEAAKENGMDALGLTDVGNLHGAIDFYKEATKAGIKPIIGVDTYVAPGSRHVHDLGTDEKRSRLVLLSENETGYRNLLKAVSLSFTEGFTDRPRMDRELLKEYHEGLIAILPSFAGDVALAFKAGDPKAARATLAEYISIFGKDNVFLEITHHPKVDGHSKRMKQIIELGKEMEVPVVAQHDVYYINPDDREATEVMRRIHHGGERGRNEDEDFSFISEKKALEFFKDVPEAVDMSKTIADRCSISLTLGNWVLPQFPVEPGKTHDQMLKERAYVGLLTRKMEQTPEVETRIEYELTVIADKKFAPYFLIVSDLLQFAKREGILTTTRGSAGGSLVSYLCGVTNVDPMFYKLPFERFLNPERPKAPDIDMDFADNRRAEVVAYAKRQYGEDRVAQIGTFGTMLARAAVRDVARALGHSYNTGDRIAKLIPIGSQGFPMTIERAMEMEEDLNTLYKEDDDVREIIDLAKRIEGCVRQTGVHAAGVVIAPSPLVEWAPVQFDPKGSGAIITQYDMYSITDEYGGVGLLKFDFLGIKNLAILSDAVRWVKETKGIDIDIETVPIDDTKTYEMLARGETEGTFQLNGSGLTRFLKELRPTSIHDINAMVALYRPGPLESIPSYIERKRNPNMVTYLDPRLKDILDRSYGVVTYQDDVLMIAITLGGYSWLQADALRKAMGKKIPAEMEAQKEKLIEGFINHGKLSAGVAEQIWKLIEPFAAYGFNKAHAASYGKVAYQTAYMKANYPVEYMTALLSAETGNIDEVAKMVGECKRMKIPVLPPDINESESSFSVRGDTIRFGLSSIKNFGEGISEAIQTERKNGAFVSLSDFLSRIGSRNLNRKSLEALIQCGAMDAFGERIDLLSNLELLLSYHRESTETAPQDSLFGSTLKAPELMIPQSNEKTTLMQKLLWEKELLGIYVSGHPLDTHQEKMDKSKLTIASVLEDPRPGLPVIMPLLVSEVRTILTKKGDKMSFVKFEDKTGTIEAVVFPKLFKEHAGLFVPGTCVLVKATVSKRNDELSLAVENVKGI